MRRLKLIGAFLCILAAWVQFMAPVAAMSMSDRLDPFGVICAKPANGGDGGSQPAPHHRHHDCALCQAYLGAPPLPERPAFTALDYPVASPLRWRGAERAPETGQRHAIFQARAPPKLI